jgi:simple sugar transport system ATP-binding protein
VVAAVAMHDITMAFGPNEVLCGIDLELEPGRVTALLGANGAGKSTLIKVLSGVYPDYGGQITIGDEPVVIDSPTTARGYGIQAVHQKISDGVVPGLTVAENLLFEGIVNNEVPRARSLRGLLPEARRMTSILDLGWSDALLRGDVYELPIADQQLLLLCRALVIQPSLLILDEPTSALSKSEAQRLFGVITQLRDQGVAVFYISHRLGEIQEIADRLIVLRDGLLRSDHTKPFSWSLALHDMLGTDQEERSRSAEMRGEESVLDLNGVRLLPTSEPFDLSIRSGEVTGVFGLLGSGGNELAHGIFGSQPFIEGGMTLSGSHFAPKEPADAIARDVYMVPEDRVAGTLIKDWSVAMIATFPFLKDVSKWAVLNGGREARVGRDIIRDFGVIAQSENDPVMSLSGGNQQKVVVGRWLRKQPRVMVLNEPFQGVDVGARHDLAEKARDVAAAGSAVIVMSTDLEEIMEVADRVLVLADGDLRFDSYLSETNRAQILERLTEVE